MRFVGADLSDSFSSFVKFVLITGYMGLSRECDALISSLCRCVVSVRTTKCLALNVIFNLYFLFFVHVRFLSGAGTPLRLREHRPRGSTHRTGTLFPWLRLWTASQTSRCCSGETCRPSYASHSRFTPLPMLSWTGRPLWTPTFN